MDSDHLRVESGKRKTREDENGVETEKMRFFAFWRIFTFFTDFGVFLDF